MKLTVVERPQRYWPSLIRSVFKGDVALLCAYHIAAPCQLGTAVADTYLALKTFDAPDFRLYGLYDNDRPGSVGMVGVEHGHNSLVTFGLSTAYRTPEGVAQLARICRKLLDDTRPSNCCLFQRNTPAQRFVRRLGFVAQPGILTDPATGHSGLWFILPPSAPCPSPLE